MTPEYELPQHILTKLLTLRQLPVLPTIATEVLNCIDDPNTSAATLSRLVERDQAMTARVLTVANSPFYGFPRKISTVDLAIVVLGFDAIKEIILSLIVQSVLRQTKSQLLDVKQFWQYSLFCGATARFIARKLKYRIVGEAFVGGLMHDIGVLILAQYFPKELQQIRTYQRQNSISMVEAEYAVMGTNHSQIGAWLIERWNLPEQLLHATAFHHSVKDFDKLHLEKNVLTAIVSLAERIAFELGYKNWALDLQPAPLITPIELTSKLNLSSKQNFESLRATLQEEFQKTSIFQ